MNLRQLRALNEIVRQGLRVSAAAEALHTSQPGVSRQILELEQELDVDIFVRRNNRLVGITRSSKLHTPPFALSASKGGQLFRAWHPCCRAQRGAPRG